MATLKAACLQLNSAADITANIAAIAPLVAEAARAGAAFVTLPENAFLMEMQGQPRTLWEEHAHPGLIAASGWAKEHGIWLLVGSAAVKTDDSGKTVNRQVLFNAEGGIAARYDKIHLFDVTLPNGEVYAESARMLPGGHAVVARTPWGNLGLSICYDVRFPHLYRQMTHAGASLIVVPAAFTAVTGEAHWHVLLRARAIENGAFVIAAAQTGTHAGGRKTFGHSLIISPWGEVLADGGTETGVVMTTLNLAQVEEVRGRIPSLTHDRSFTLVTGHS
ncbi:MAG: carbon-nitrogen hydrolase family protein [Rickettsiales bacterium]|nr:carbon-nitrogen hydrolase family protein [Rickettsiales bacterium]